MAGTTHLFEPATPGITFTADAAITSGQVLYVSAARQVTPTAGASAAVIGVAATDAADGDKLNVLVGGVVKVVASAAISAGGLVVSAADGKVAPIAANTFDKLVGRALTAAAADGDVIEIRLGV
ncbi:capsid cement protein [Microbacterium sp. NPDC078428]|uniref:capsid cement protein n=1 Tax=Microbacterium sp. NPDC078428 TaxID=3364190 RepID=UPI0037C7C990